jgi:PKD repeat protein
MAKRPTLAVAVIAVLAFPPIPSADESGQRTDGPVAVPAADVASGTVPLKVCFDGSESYHPRRKALVFRWDFGDGRGAASEARACHEYIQAGLYAATVTVTDDQGLTDSRAFIVSVREER